MCKAMNRSLVNVLFGTMGPTADTPDADDVYRTVKSTSADEIAMLLDGAQRVVIIPGYGMAVAQAQHAVRDLANQLEARGANVEYAIHPVAGRISISEIRSTGTRWRNGPILDASQRRPSTTS